MHPTVPPPASGRARAISRLPAAAALALAVLATPASATELVMVEQPGCYHCAQWHKEIGPAYPRTAAGAHAPLRPVMIRDIPDDLSFERRVVFTPTFIVVDADGTELGRLEGYPGADFFWPLIEALLGETSGFSPPEPGR